LYCYCLEHHQFQCSQLCFFLSFLLSFFPSLIKRLPLIKSPYFICLITCGPTLTAWRVVFQKLLFWQRKKGQNTRTAVIIGATPPGYNLAMQIQPNDQLGIQFKGFFDHRDLNRLSHEFTGRITGNVEQVIALAFLYFFMLISMWFNIFYFWIFYCLFAVFISIFRFRFNFITFSTIELMVNLKYSVII
jgi:FlaA1/EpsC-like NDP-sugar epimerase